MLQARILVSIHLEFSIWSTAAAAKSPSFLSLSNFPKSIRNKNKIKTKKYTSNGKPTSLFPALDSLTTEDEFLTNM